MKSKELYDKLETLSTKDIQIGVAISVRYLVKSRGLKLREIIKDLKNFTKCWRCKYEN